MKKEQLHHLHMPLLRRTRQGGRAKLAARVGVGAPEKQALALGHVALAARRLQHAALALLFDTFEPRTMIIVAVARGVMDLLDIQHGDVYAVDVLWPQGRKQPPHPLHHLHMLLPCVGDLLVGFKYIAEVPDTTPYTIHYVIGSRKIENNRAMYVESMLFVM